MAYKFKLNAGNKMDFVFGICVPVMVDHSPMYPWSCYNQSNNLLYGTTIIIPSASDNGHQIQTKIEPGQASQTDQYHMKILSCYIHCYSVLLLQTARQKLARKIKDLPITNHQYCIQMLIVFIVANAHFIFFGTQSLNSTIGRCRC